MQSDACAIFCILDFIASQRKLKTSLSNRCLFTRHDSLDRVIQGPVIIQFPAGAYPGGSPSKIQPTLIASFDLPALVQKTVGWCTSGHISKHIPEIHCPTLSCTGAGKLNEGNIHMHFDPRAFSSSKDVSSTNCFIDQLFSRQLRFACFRNKLHQTVATKRQKQGGRHFTWRCTCDKMSLQRAIHVTSVDVVFVWMKCVHEKFTTKGNSAKRVSTKR